ncbi:hypothetical protein CEXT_120801 [Caerostris extrusa]|uniref:Uncharacterized protein n=1 Tax=Caerostris extrusa TaxID=172846 RepID=A0AAV4PRQ2_CAEEX|nr:hypothetical protein CEXT_120801 [Caerostris extrusa]
MKSTILSYQTSCGRLKVAHVTGTTAMCGQYLILLPSTRKNNRPAGLLATKKHPPVTLSEFASPLFLWQDAERGRHVCRKGTSTSIKKGVVVLFHFARSSPPLMQSPLVVRAF